ncbi:hypothetical protein [Sutcliffiella cohnii]|uniref:Flagellar hook-length control protein-like C-terminal domain-containing protein n=1 Tax=Sutcliffiella cohnii TaxID=33932 RepID=A0A223KRG8_9BACI|nr:hypothetical protein [Sutcliffiella cohnii]AST92072.1 hypothetical protein BC6307_12680 [Sutcliffiella cohnii]MED4015356.1 hypothetical protein [Sutcliffiella cohnii]
MHINAHFSSRIDPNQATSQGQLFNGKVLHKENGLYTIISKGVEMVATVTGNIEVGKSYIFLLDNNVQTKGKETVFSLQLIRPTADQSSQPSFPIEKADSSNILWKKLTPFFNSDKSEELHIKSTINTFVNSRGDSIPAQKLIEIMSLPLLQGLGKSVQTLLSHSEANSSTALNINHTVQKMLAPITVTPSILQSKENFMIFLQSINDILQSLNYEANVKNSKLSEQLLENNLKFYVTELMSATNNKKTESLLNTIVQTINGYQLFAREEGGIQQHLFPLLFLNEGKYTDWYMHLTKYNGEKDDNAESTRILFLLDLPNISQTMVDLQVFRQTLSITIVNEHARSLQRAVEALKPILKGNVSKLGFRLSRIKLLPLEEEEYSVRTVFVKEILAPLQNEVDIRL